VGAAGSVWLLGNVDVVLARATLGHHQAGIYSAGALVARAVQFAPQFIVLASFARLTDVAASRAVLWRAGGRLIAIGLLATLGAAVTAPWAVRLVFGGGYRELAHVVWVFAVLGTLLALNQLLLSQRVARHDERAAVAVWLATVAFASAGALVPGLSPAGLVALACVANLALAAVLVARIAARP
jgi:O-antigen/teichoic acid export membrane protein